MLVTIIFDVVTRDLVPIAEGCLVDIEVTDEEYKRITASYETAKYARMFEDEELQDICDRCSAVVNGFDDSDPEAFEMETEDSDRDLIYCFDYPFEVKADHAELVWVAGYDEIAGGELIPPDAKLKENGDGTYTVS